MTTEKLIQKVREKTGSLSSENEQILATAMQILHDAENASLPPPSEENFLSRNITLEDYKALPRDEKRHYHDEAEKLNQHWVESQFRIHNAEWIMVVDGQVVRSGATLDDFTDHEELLEICHKTGKYPFAFFSKWIFAIEEQSTAWHNTHKVDDAYPALSIRLAGNNNLFEAEADLDTGATDCYGSLELLITRGIVTIHPDDVERSSQHLNKSFFYFTKDVWLELTDMTGVIRRWRTSIICVENWRSSSFTAINPGRTILLGRRILLNLRPRLTLDFDAHLTEVEFKKTTV